MRVTRLLNGLSRIVESPGFWLTLVEYYSAQMTVERG